MGGNWGKSTSARGISDDTSQRTSILLRNLVVYDWAVLLMGHRRRLDVVLGRVVCHSARGLLVIGDGVGLFNAHNEVCRWRLPQTGV